MTCSARLPVYALLIGAFIPQKTVWGVFNQQGLVLFGLYAAGILSALAMSWIMKKWRRDKSEHPLMLELPSYRLPHARDGGGAVRARHDLPQARRRHHPGADHPAVGAAVVPSGAGGRHDAGHRL